jgi:hypothetical protein
MRGLSREDRLVLRLGLVWHAHLRVEISQVDAQVVSPWVETHGMLGNPYRFTQQSHPSERLGHGALQTRVTLPQHPCGLVTDAFCRGVAAMATASSTAVAAVTRRPRASRTPWTSQITTRSRVRSSCPQTGTFQHVP